MASKYIGDMCVRTGTYEDANGQKKGRYEKLGPMFEDDQGRISFLLTMVPLTNFGDNGGVWCSFFPKRDQNQQAQPPQQQQRQQQQKQQQQNNGGNRGAWG